MAAARKTSKKTPTRMPITTTVPAELYGKISARVKKDDTSLARVTRDLLTKWASR